MTTSSTALAARVEQLAPAADATLDRSMTLRALVVEGFADLPQPGSGGTIVRWQALATVAARDLALVKLFEGHADARATLREAGVQDVDPAATWGLWAAEPPEAQVVARPGNAERVRLDGVKAWCSGAGGVDHGLLTVRDAEGRHRLARVALRQPGVSFDGSAWKPVGMVDSGSVSVRFDDVDATLVGPPDFYLSRPGFWQGGAGIAACWHGATCAIADTLHRSARAAPDAGWHRLLALGQVDRVLSANAALLREAAAWIDAHPHDDARGWALRTRAAADEAAQFVLAATTRALGATPLCRDSAFARRAADLPVFIRQCHADRDLAALGQELLAVEDTPWRL